MNAPRVLLLALALALLSAGCAPDRLLIEGDAAFVVPADDLELADLVGSAITTWQPAVPYALTLQVGGDARGEWDWRVTREQPLTRGALAGTDPDSARIRVSPDVPARWAAMVVLHEVGHALGFGEDHSEAGCSGDEPNVMGESRSHDRPNVVPHPCELEQLASWYGVELPPGSEPAGDQ